MILSTGTYLDSESCCRRIGGKRRRGQSAGGWRSAGGWWSAGRLKSVCGWGSIGGQQASFPTSSLSDQKREV